MTINRIRDVYGNEKCGIFIPPVGFPWEWEKIALTNVNGTGMGMAQMGMGALVF